MTAAVAAALWSVQQVSDWVELEVGLPAAAGTLAAQHVSGQLLLLLGQAELQELGVTTGVERKKILLARAKLLDPPAAPELQHQDRAVRRAHSAGAAAAPAGRMATRTGERRAAKRRERGDPPRSEVDGAQAGRGGQHDTASGRVAAGVSSRTGRHAPGHLHAASSPLTAGWHAISFPPPTTTLLLEPSSPAPHTQSSDSSLLMSQLVAARLAGRVSPRAASAERRNRLAGGMRPGSPLHDSVHHSPSHPAAAAASRGSASRGSPDRAARYPSVLAAAELAVAGGVAAVDLLQATSPTAPPPICPLAALTSAPAGTPPRMLLTQPLTALHCAAAAAACGATPESGNSTRQ